MGRVLAVIIWLITLGSVSLFFVKKWWFPAAISQHAAALDRQFLLTITVVGIAFTAAQVGLGYVVWKFKDRGPSDRAVYTHGSNRLEVVWTVVTAVIFISLAVMGQSVWASLHFNKAPENSFRVQVVAQQFQWNFHYSGKDGVFGRTDPSLVDDSALNYVGLDSEDPNAKDDVVHSVIAIPVDQPVELILRSRDVIHNFWVPQLRFKQDLVPGMNISVHFTANRVGKYELACAELCGQFHFRMKSYLLVLPADEHAALMKLTQDEFQTRMTELLAKYPLPDYPQ
ncbi:MAG TPA: cytochrome c oxidase subunit II [Pyrinomonadaceae bacterium]|nr:cytochrome c oxidase subunit II [Pyrinomonadaceae bacterium]